MRILVLVLLGYRAGFALLLDVNYVCVCVVLLYISGREGMPWHPLRCYLPPSRTLCRWWFWRLVSCRSYGACRRYPCLLSAGRRKSCSERRDVLVPASPLRRRHVVACRSSHAVALGFLAGGGAVLSAWLSSVGVGVLGASCGCGRVLLLRACSPSAGELLECRSWPCGVDRRAVRQAARLACGRQSRCVCWSGDVE
jgi:hypothetical protein